MDLLLEIKTENIPDESILEPREAVRAVVFDENGLMPLIFASKYNFYKIPGGGIERNENKEQALIREALEESGSEIQITGEIGKVVEYRLQFNQKQISYCYLGKVISKNKTTFTEKELSEGFELIWTTLDDAITKIKNEHPQNYQGKFVQKRELAILQKVKELTNY